MTLPCSPVLPRKHPAQKNQEATQNSLNSSGSARESIFAFPKLLSLSWAGVGTGIWVSGARGDRHVL